MPGLTAPSGGGAEYYPPTLTGLRGAHPGAFEVAHALAREGKRFDNPQALDETYDLIVVGGGISGLAAAYYYRKLHGAQSRILILDNHDDFGGHAKRNEFHQGGPMRLAWGGTVNLEYTLYSQVAKDFIRELGIDIPRLRKDYSFNWLASHGHLKPALLFNAAHYGRDVLLPGVTLDYMAPKTLASTSMRFRCRTTRARRSRPSCSRAATCSRTWRRRSVMRTCMARATAISCARIRLPDAALQVIQQRALRLLGNPAEHLSVAECLQVGLPGAHVLGGPHDEDTEERDSPEAMFPDGNSSIARLLVRSLIPGAVPGMAAGADPFDIVTTRPDYGALDRSGSAVRLRLNSTAVHVANEAGGVAIDYVKDGSVLRVTAKQAVLACYNAIIPYIAPELPPAQKAALAKCVKRPMLVVNTLLRNGRALQALGIKGAQLPGSFLQNQFLVTGINVGDYHPTWQPEDPCVMQAFASFGDPQPGARPREPGAHGAREDARHVVRGLRARSPQRAEQPARPRRLRRRARHPRHHRQPLAARLRARSRRPRGCGLERGAGARDRRPAAFRQHRDRELRRRRGRVHARRDRPGVAGGQRTGGPCLEPVLDPRPDRATGQRAAVSLRSCSSLTMTSAIAATCCLSSAIEASCALNSPALRTGSR